MSKRESYKTKDLSEAAFLYASGRLLIGLEEEEPGRFWFVFGDGDVCRRLADSFWSRQATVNAKEYADAIRTMKDMLFARLRTRNGDVYRVGRQAH